MSQSTFVLNSARLGGGFFLAESSGSSGTLNLEGCIFYFNDGGEDPSKPSFSAENYSINPRYSLFPEAIVDQTNFNINSNPEFFNSNSNFRLKSNSPAIDKGEGTALPLSPETNDIDGNFRSLGALMDMGAYEFLTCPQSNVIYVDDNAPGSKLGRVASSALSSINMALHMACNCDTIPVIHIAEGRYVPHRIDDLTIAEDQTTHSFEMTCPVVLQGNDGAILTGDILKNDNSDMNLNPTRDDNCVDLIRAVGIDKLSIDNLEFRSSNRAAVVMSDEAIFAGDLNKDAVISNCDFFRNGFNVLEMVSFGDNANTLKVENCKFIRNFHNTKRSDGCIRVVTTDYIDVEIVNCEFRDNDIGGVYIKTIDSSRTNIEKCSFSNNTSLVGGGIEIDDISGESSYHTITNCEFVDNTGSGAAVNGRRSGDTNYEIYNCTFFRNFTNSISSSPVHFSGTSGSAKIENSIFWGNENLRGPRGISGDMDLSYSMLETDQCPTIGNPNIRCGEVMYYNVDPHFVNEGSTAGPKLRLKAFSLAIDRGSKRRNPFGSVTYDIGGAPRYQSNRIDLGAYEFQPNSMNGCPKTFTNPVAAPETNLDLSMVADSLITLSQDYITPATGALFLDASETVISPSLEIQSGAVMEIHTTGCINSSRN